MSTDPIYEAQDQTDDQISSEVTSMLKEFDGLGPAPDVGPDGKPMGGTDQYYPSQPAQEPQGALGLRPTEPPVPPGYPPQAQPEGYPPAPEPQEPPAEAAPEPDIAAQLAEANARLAMYQNMLGGAPAPGVPGQPGQPPGMATPTAIPGMPPLPVQTAPHQMAPTPPQQAAPPPQAPQQPFDFLQGADLRDMEPAEVNQRLNEALAHRDNALWEKFSQKAAEISLNTMHTAAKNTMDYETHINAPGNEWVKQDQQGFDWCLQETQTRYPHLAHDMAAQCQLATQRLQQLRAQAGIPGAPQAAPPPATSVPPKAHIPRVAPAEPTRIATGAPSRKGQKAFMSEFMVGHEPS